MTLYFWQNMPAMHQVPYQRELAAMGHAVVLCVDRLMLPERAAMGWLPEDTSGLTLHVGLDRAAAKKIVDDSPSDAVHLVSGVRGMTLGGWLTRYAAKTGRRVCWINEAWDPRGLKGLLRRVLFTAESFRYGSSVHRIFAMGEMGGRAYRSAGYGAKKVVEFNYVTPLAGGGGRDVSSRSAPFVFGYVGALIPRKRVDVLLRALALLPSDVPPWILEVHGDGPSKPALAALAADLGISDRIRWGGRFESSEAAARMAGLSSMILPSDFDGWGAVVNEALLCGVPVIASDACGASCVPLRHGWGSAFRAGDARSCADACLKMLQRPPPVDPRAVDAILGARATAARMAASLNDA